MRIGIDARALGWAGLGRYTRNLLNNLVALSGKENYFVVFGPRVYGSEVGNHPRIKFVSVTSSYYSVREQTVFLAALLKEKIDVMHFLHFNAPIYYRRPFVVSVHDLTRFFFPAQKNKSNFHQWAYELVFKNAINNSKKIITVSEHTRTDLIRHFPNLSQKVSVVYEGVDIEKFNTKKASEESLISRPYILFAGVWMTHKNLPRLLGAFKKIIERGYEGNLVITGEGKKHHVDVPKIAENMGLKKRVIFPGYVTDGQLKDLFQNADLFVFPSLYEGFGLPSLEALACGTPVVASRVSSIPEILGDAALYFDPYSVDDMADKIYMLLRDQLLRAKLVELGLQRSNLFTWKKCAEQTLEIYSKVVI